MELIRGFGIITPEGETEEDSEAASDEELEGASEGGAMVSNPNFVRMQGSQ